MTDRDIAQLLAGSPAQFEAATKSVERNGGAHVVVALLEALDQSELPNSESERRLNVVLSRVPLDVEQLATVAKAGAKLHNLVLQNALTQLLPPEVRRLVHRPDSPEVQAPIKPWQAEVITPAPPQDGAPSYSVVVILSSEIDPAARALLEGSRFLPLRFELLDSLAAFLQTSADVCAFFVESSFLQRLDTNQQRKLFQLLGEYSTFALVRCQAEALQIDRIEVGNIIARAHCTATTPGYDRLAFEDRSVLHQAELTLLERARDRLAAGDTTSKFLPEEITEDEIRLLGAAMTEYGRQKRFNNHAELTSVSMKFLQGGAGAKVALIRVNDLRWPVIVKLDTKSNVREETLRFRTYIEAYNRDLRPEVHLHAGAALIIFDVIATGVNGTIEPAPTLAKVLGEYWFAEMFDVQNGNDGIAILQAVANAADGLALLNKQRCPDHTFDIRANPLISYVQRMEEAGFDWGFGDVGIAARSNAEAILALKRDSGICHGDAHLGNVLIDDTRGHVIDYAYSGPGHPCVDLAKLELSIFFHAFHPFGNEQSIIDFQRDLTFNLTSADDLILSHCALMKSRTNKLCVRLCVSVRRAVAEVLEAHHIGWEHYQAAKLLSCWQALQCPDLPQSTVRAVISALTIV
jgi:hypothetical protein